MKRFSSWDDVEIAYREWGEPRAGWIPVVLQHGFVVDGPTNWQAPGIVAALVAAGHHVIAPDARGHGSSQKPHDPARYGEQRIARDLSCLFDEIGTERVDLVGYSMGAMAALLCACADERVHRLVIGGVGSGVIECGGVDRRTVPNDAIIAALSAEDAGTVEPPAARAFRALADAVGADREALVAQARSVYRGQPPLERITAPVLLLAGREDPLAVRPGVLVAALADARLELVPGDHAGAVAAPEFTRAIVEFLA